MKAYAVEEVVLQRPPMLLVDAIAGYGEDWIECTSRLQANNYFANTHNQIPSWAGLEYMYQTVAALEGCLRLNHGYTVLMGFAMGARRYKAHTPFFHMHQTVTVRAETEMKDKTSIGVYRCTIKNEKTLLAESLVKAVMPEDASFMFS